MRFYAEQATRGHHPQDIVESDPAAVSSCVEPEQSFELPHDQPQDVVSQVAYLLLLRQNVSMVAVSRNAL